MIYYYESRFRRADGYYGVVYHWESDEQVIDLKGDYFDNSDEAIDAIVQEAEENGLEPLEMA